MKRAIAIVLLLLIAVGCAYAVNDEAQRHAQSADVPSGLSDREAEIYRQGYAAGYYDALYPQDDANVFILNKNSHKFHLPSCSSAKSIKEKTREEYHGTRNELIAMGYEPCSNCNP